MAEQADRVTGETGANHNRVARGAAGGIAGAAMLIMVGNLLSRVLGLAREQLASGLFGTSDKIAAFQIADNVQTLLFDLVLSGMLEAALVPVLVRWAAPDLVSRAELRRVAGALLALVTIVVGVAVVLGELFASRVVKVMTALGGDETAHSAATTALTVDLVRIILPAVLFLAVGTVLMSVAYSLKKVTTAALSLAARNAIVVLAMVLFSGMWGVKSMAAGVVAGALAIAVMNGVSLWRAGVLPSLNLRLGHPAVREILGLQLPIFLGLLVSTLAIVVDRNLAWRAETDALGAMRYATTLVQFLLGMVAAAISLAALPTLSEHHSNSDHVAFRGTLERALAMVTVLIVPAVFGLAVLSRPVVNLLFRHGATDDHDARRIVIALLCYLPGTLCAAYDQILIYGFYARRNTWRPVLAGAAATMVYFAVALWLGREIGMVGLVLANSAQFLAHLAIMVGLTRRARGKPHWRALIPVMARTFIAAGAMAAAVLAIWFGLDRAMPVANTAAIRVVVELLAVAVPAFAGVVIYGVLMHLLGVQEASQVRRSVLGRLHPMLAR